MGIIHQDADRQVAGLRVGHPAHERDLAGHPLFLRGRGIRRGSRASAGRTRAACPTRTDEADRVGSQTDAKTCRVSTTSPIGLPMAIVWPGWQVRLSSTPSIGARIVW